MSDIACSAPAVTSGVPPRPGAASPRSEATVDQPTIARPTIARSTVPRSIARPTAPRSTAVRALSTVLRVATVAALMWAIVAGWPQLRLAVTALAEADKALVLVALGCQLAALALVTTTYRAALASAGARIGFRQAGGVALRAGTVSRLVPGGGAAAALFAMRRLRRSGVPDGPAVAGVAINGIVMMAMLASVVAVGSGASPGLAALWMVGAAGTVIALGRPRVRDRLATFADRLRRRGGLLATGGEAVATVAERPLRTGPLSAATCAAAAAWCCELAALWFVIAGVADPMPLSTVAMGLGAANAAAALPHTPGGIGVVEVAVTAAFVAAGADASLALAGVLGYRAIGFWLPALLGLILLGMDKLGRREQSPAPVGSVRS